MHTQSAIRADAIRPTAVPGRHNGPDGSADGRGLECSALHQAMQMMGAMMAYPRNSEIFGENEPADYLYKVVTGSVRTYKILSDGRRQVGGFYLPGDIFGLEFSDEHTLSAESIAREDISKLLRMPSAISATIPWPLGGIS